jgi:hypothetical protein
VAYRNFIVFLNFLFHCHGGSEVVSDPGKSGAFSVYDFDKTFEIN